VISRETRRLLITIVVSVTALWILARIRFQDRPAAATPVPNVLAQLRPASSFADLARTVADIRPAIAAAVSASAGGAPALRVGEDSAATLRSGDADTVRASDRATGLAIVRHPQGDPVSVMPWAPRVLDYPRYVIAADVLDGHVMLRPVFLPGLLEASSALWSGDVWTVPDEAALEPGAFVFTTDGAFAGMAISHAGGKAIVPATLLFAEISRLQKATGTPGVLGIEVQRLTPEVARAMKASAGVVVTAIDPASSAAGELLPTDVIEAIDGVEVRTPEHWRARVARVSAGETVALRVRGVEGTREVSVTAAPQPAPPEPVPNESLGLTLRTLSKVGVEVVAVQPGSRGDRAGIREGDTITVMSGRPSPTRADMVRAFASLPDGGSALVAFTRGDGHHVTVIQKRLRLERGAQPPSEGERGPVSTRK
jgi:hypothetical protein